MAIVSNTVLQDFEEYIGDTLQMKFNWIAGGAVYENIDLTTAVITSGIITSGAASYLIGGRVIPKPTLSTATVITGTQVDLTGYSARMHVKADINSATPLQVGAVTLGGAINNIVCILTNIQTTALGAGKFVYDIELTDTLGTVNTFAIGKIKLRPSVTI